MQFTLQPTVVIIVVIMFMPTIPYCSMGTLIGLCYRVKLLRSLPSRFQFVVQIKPDIKLSTSRTIK